MVVEKQDGAQHPKVLIIMTTTQNKDLCI